MGISKTVSPRNETLRALFLPNRSRWLSLNRRIETHLYIDGGEC